MTLSNYQPIVLLAFTVKFLKSYPCSLPTSPPLFTLQPTPAWGLSEPVPSMLLNPGVSSLASSHVTFQQNLMQSFTPFFLKHLHLASEVLDSPGFLPLFNLFGYFFLVSFPGSSSSSQLLNPEAQGLHPPILLSSGCTPRQVISAGPMASNPSPDLLPPSGCLWHRPPPPNPPSSGLLLHLYLMATLGQNSAHQNQTPGLPPNLSLPPLYLMNPRPLSCLGQKAQESPVILPFPRI